MKKRIFTLMLALCLAFSMMPVPAFAEGDVTEPITETVAPEETKKSEEPTAAQKVQALIDALPETVTAENRAEVEAQLTAIDDAKEPLGDEERTALDFGKYNAAVAAINVLDNQPGAEVPKTMEVQYLEGATVSVTKTFRYNGAPQTLTEGDVAVTLGEKNLAAGTDYTVTAASQTYPGTYSFSVTGKGNYTGEVPETGRSRRANWMTNTRPSA